MYVCVCGKLRALSHEQSDAKLRLGVTGCFTIIFIFMHAESIPEEDEILERLLPGPGVLGPCHHHSQCPGPYPVVCRHERSPHPPGRNHHSGGHTGHHLMLEETQRLVAFNEY